MRFSPSFLDEIRARLPVSEVVGRRVKLRKQGREWAGLSPFNAEKTPSFFVNDHKGFYHDFSSGRHGDIFRFLMETEGVGFPEAVERLAGMAGVSMPTVSREAVEEEKKRASLHEVLALAARFFEDNLQSSLGAKARGYLADRRLDTKVQRAFGLGYAPGERFALRDALAAKGVAVDQMIAAGLLVHNEEVTVPYDRFRDRVMFPIHDRRGRVIGFGGRAMEAGAPAKYLNSPETELFHKGSVLFNHHRARQSAHEKGEVIAVEGYIDVIQMSAAGFGETVAPLGTALTQEQCELLWRMAGEPILCFDGDKAGRKAAFRAIDVALPLIGPGKSLRFALLPEGQDPDDLVRSAGPSAVEEVLKGAKPLAEMLFLRETEGQIFDTPERRAGLERRLRELVATIADEPLRRYYRDDMEMRLGAFFGAKPVASPSRFAARRDKRRGYFEDSPRLGVATLPIPNAQALTEKQKVSLDDAVVLLTAANHPDLLSRHVEAIAVLELSGRTALLRDRLLEFDAEESGRGLAERLLAAGFSKEWEQLNTLASRMPEWRRIKPEASIDEAERVLLERLEKLALHREEVALNKERQLAQKAWNEAPSEQTDARLGEVQQKLIQLAAVKSAIGKVDDLSEEQPV